MRETSNDLPPGWAECRADTILTFRYGKGLPATKRRPGHVGVYASAGRVGEHDESLTDRPTIVIGRKGAAGKVTIALEPSWTIDTAYYVEPPEAINLRFFAYQLEAANLGALDQSTAIPSLSRDDLNALAIRVAPVEEQDRIVAIIEELFQQIDGAAASLEQARSHATLQRQALSTYALTGPWAMVELRELLREPLRNGHSAKASGSAAGIRTLTLTAVTTGKFIDSHTKLTAADPGRVKDLWIEPGDIFVERSNTPELVGTAALYRGERGWAIFPDLLIRVRVTDAVLPEFVELVMKEERARRFFRAAAQGIAGSMPKIAQETVMALPIPLPKLEDQHRIVARVQGHEGTLDESLADIDKAEGLAESLRRTTLRAAFAGQLVAQDPADAPAADLLHSLAATS